jgi:Na+-translocating ferredoxin:NAD+ oxidoreductase subunit G
MNTIVKPTLILLLVTFISTLALSHIKKITYPNILKQEKEKLETALNLVLPGYTVTDKEGKKASVDGKDFQYWTAERQNGPVVEKAYAFITEKPGYSGPVRSMVGMDAKGLILSISIIQQSETPGLGQRSTEIASKETFIGHFFGGEKPVEENLAPWFQDQFKGIDSSKKIEIVKRGDWKPEIRDELMKKNAISAITGATVTTRAVRDSVATGFETLRKALESDIQKGGPVK